MPPGCGFSLSQTRNLLSSGLQNFLISALAFWLANRIAAVARAANMRLRIQLPSDRFAGYAPQIPLSDQCRKRVRATSGGEVPSGGLVANVFCAPTVRPCFFRPN